MKSTRILAVAVLGLAVVAVAGCDETYTIKIINATSEVQNVQILENGTFTAATAAVAPDGGRASCKVKQDSGEHISYTFKTNRRSTEFTLPSRFGNPVKFIIDVDGGIAGPMSDNAEYKSKVESEVKTPIIINKEKVE